MPVGGKMRPMDNDITHADVEALRKRFQLVEGDRKAYFETYEQTKRQNDETIREMRASNQELRKSISNRKRGAVGKRGRNQADDEVDAETKRVHHLRAEYDRLRHHSKKLSKELTHMEDTLRELERQSEPVAAQESPLNRKIRMLENRLDKAMIKYNEAQSIRTTYTQIVKRLTEERVGFDNQLAAIERTLGAKQNDYQELLLLSGDAKHAKEKALQELEQVRKQYNERCTQRQGDVKDREFIMKQREQLNSRIAERETQRQQLMLEASGDLNKEGEDKLKKALAVSQLQHTQSEAEASNMKMKLEKFDSAFRRIKEATGVADIDEVIQKITTQEESQKNLMTLSADNQSKIEKLVNAQSKLRARVEEVKYAGGPGRTGARKVVDELEEQLLGANGRLDSVRQKYERMQRVLIDGQAGIEHLHTKMEHITVGDIREVRKGSVVDYLYNSETKLAQMCSLLKTEAKLAQTTGASSSESMATALKEADLASSRPFNRRVNLPSEDNSDAKAFDEAEYVEGGDEEGVTREQMKLAARERLNLHTNKGKKPRKKKKSREEEAMRRRKPSRGHRAGGARRPSQV